MGFMDSLKKAIQGPVRVGDGGDDPGEVAADLHEEYVPPHEADTELETVKEISEGPRGTGAIAGFGRVGGQAGTVHSNDPGSTGLPGAGETDAGMGPEEDSDNAFPDN